LGPGARKVFGLQGFNLQHRSQENFGCTYSNGHKFDHFKDRGLVSQVFTKERREHFSRTQPLIAIAQTRYATAGGTDAISAQPHWMTLLDGFYSNACNGDLPLLEREIDELEKSGTVMLSGNDGEVILKKILHGARDNGGDLVAGIRRLMETTPGAYSGCLMTLTELYLYRDRTASARSTSALGATRSCSVRVVRVPRARRARRARGLSRRGDPLRHSRRTGHYQAVPRTAAPAVHLQAIYFRAARQPRVPTRRVGHSATCWARSRRSIPSRTRRWCGARFRRYAASGYAGRDRPPLRDAGAQSVHPAHLPDRGPKHREDLVRLKFTAMQSLLHSTANS
jgi:hypothetical protein